jgi:hypothetical protein
LQILLYLFIYCYNVETEMLVQSVPFDVTEKKTLSIWSTFFDSLQVSNNWKFVEWLLLCLFLIVVSLSLLYISYFLGRSASSSLHFFSAGQFDSSCTSCNRSSFISLRWEQDQGQNNPFAPFFPPNEKQQQCKNSILNGMCTGCWKEVWFLWEVQDVK